MLIPAAMFTKTMNEDYEFSIVMFRSPALSKKFHLVG